jgi:transposase-like protein
MSKSDLQNPAFSDENAAREALEAIRWPDGPFCPHCGNLDQEKITKGEGKASRPGLYYCAACNGQFTVTVGTVMERSKIPLSKWLFAMHLMGASKKGVSALQLQRMLGMTYKTAWFLCHRIREAMKPAKRGPLGGHGKIVEADETFIGGKSTSRAYKPPRKKEAVFALVERDGESHSFHVANVKAKTLRDAIEKTADPKSSLMTDEAPHYVTVGREFASHGSVNHSQNEYVRRERRMIDDETFTSDSIHTNTAESRFSLMKRAVFGTHHSVSEAHLQRYLVEWDFKWNTRKTTDGERAALIAKGIEGKRLTYRPTH